MALVELAASESALQLVVSVTGLALKQLVDQLRAAPGTPLRHRLLEALSLQAVTDRLEISSMAVQWAQEKGLVTLRQKLIGAGQVSSC